MPLLLPSITLLMQIFKSLYVSKADLQKYESNFSRFHFWWIQNCHWNVQVWLTINCTSIFSQLVCKINILQDWEGTQKSTLTPEIFCSSHHGMMIPATGPCAQYHMVDECYGIWLPLPNAFDASRHTSCSTCWHMSGDENSVPWKTFSWLINLKVEINFLNLSY